MGGSLHRSRWKFFCMLQPCRLIKLPTFQKFAVPSSSVTHCLTTWPWRWRRYGPSKHRRPGVTSQKTWIFSHVAARTSNLILVSLWTQNPVHFFQLGTVKIKAPASLSVNIVCLLKIYSIGILKQNTWNTQQWNIAYSRANEFRKPEPNL
jgi:hypothetical protein